MLCKTIECTIAPLHKKLVDFKTPCCLTAREKALFENGIDIQQLRTPRAINALTGQILNCSPDEINNRRRLLDQIDNWKQPKFSFAGQEIEIPVQGASNQIKAVEELTIRDFLLPPTIYSSEPAKYADQYVRKFVCQMLINMLGNIPQRQAPTFYWSILENTSSEEFYLADQPICFQNPIRKNKIIFRGISDHWFGLYFFPGIEFYYPLSPTICLLLQEKFASPPPAKHFIGRTQVLRINEMFVKSASRFIYARKPSFRFVDYLSLRRSELLDPFRGDLEYQGKPSEDELKRISARRTWEGIKEKRTPNKVLIESTKPYKCRSSKVQALVRAFYLQQRKSTIKQTHKLLSPTGIDTMKFSASNS